MSTKLIDDLLAHLSSISQSFNLRKGKVVAHIAGGIAVNYYTAARASDDMDIQWSHRVLIPIDKRAFITEDPEGNPLQVSVDTGFSESIGLFHPDWKEDALPIIEFPNLNVKVITPVDLVVSKIGRFIERDRDDIRMLALHDPFTLDDVAQRAEEALDYYVGDLNYVRTSIQLALEIIREVRRDEPSAGL